MNSPNSSQETTRKTSVVMKTEHETDSKYHEKFSRNSDVTDLNIVKEELSTAEVSSPRNKEINQDIDINLEKACHELDEMFKSNINWVLMRTKERMMKDRENKDVAKLCNKYILTVKNWPTYWGFTKRKEFIDKEYAIIDKMEIAVDSENCCEGMIRLGFDSLAECKRAKQCLDGKEIAGRKLLAIVNDYNPNNSVENSDFSMEKPDNNVKDPDNSMGNPDNPDNTGSSIDKSNYSKEDLAEESISDSESSEPQPKRRRLTEEPWRPDIDVWEKDGAGLYGLKPEFLKCLGITPPIDEWVHVTNFRCDKSELKEVMELAGQVVTCTIVARSQKYAKVRFSHPLEAVQAVSMLNNKLFYGQPLKVLMDQCPSDRVILPKGLESVGPGLGETGTPLRDIVRQYERYVKGRPSSVNTNIFSNPDEKLFSFDVKEADISFKANQEDVNTNQVLNENKTQTTCKSTNSVSNETSSDSTLAVTSVPSLPNQQVESSQSLAQTSNYFQRPIGNEQSSQSWCRSQNPIPSGPAGNWSIDAIGNHGPIPGNSGPISGNSGPMLGNTGPMHGNTGSMHGNTGHMSGNTGPLGPLHGNTGSISGNTGPITGNIGQIHGNTGHMPYTGPLTNTRNMSGFAGSLPHTRALTGNTGPGPKYTSNAPEYMGNMPGYNGNLSGQNGPINVNTGLMPAYTGPMPAYSGPMPAYTGNKPGYTGLMTGDTGPLQGHRNITGYGLTSGNSVHTPAYTGNVPENFGMRTAQAPGPNGPNSVNTGPMSRPMPGPSGPNLGPNRTYAGPSGPYGSHTGGPSRPTRESPTDFFGPESPNINATRSPKINEDYVALEIRNLPLNTSFPVLCEKMSKCGQVMSLQLTEPGSAVIQYAARVQAERCFQMYNHYRVLDNIIELRYL